MPTELSSTAIVEKSTIVIRASFSDEDGTPEAPGTLSWTLTTSAGVIVNSREDVEVVSPTANEDIVLYGDDLAILGTTDNRIRILTLQGTYDSVLGSNLPINDSCTFMIQDLVAVS